jgi:hypothetical protein
MSPMTWFRKISDDTGDTAHSDGLLCVSGELTVALLTGHRREPGHDGDPRGSPLTRSRDNFTNPPFGPFRREITFMGSVVAS